ncbi:MAG: hypothetical protein JOS17DRAFT_761012 [Linnemannia elongata]|nr:MAG: hypothetical protein JOS17DRAFT_761012 [Linnemannia elongata]
MTYASQDQNYHHMHQQHYLWQPLSPPQLQQQHRHQQQHGSGQQYVYPGIHPHLEEASHETQAGDVWLAQINGVNSKTLELSTAAHRRAIPVSSTSFTTEGGYIRSSSSIKLSTTPVEMALFGELFPDTTNTTTATTSSASPPPKIITINPASTTLPPSPSSRYKTQASYSSAISRRLTTCPWSHIATLTVPGRTGVQAQARWSEALDPRVKKGPWSEEEDALLLEGVERSDKCWIWIADSIEGRTQRQCRTRWVQLTINAERKAALAALESVTEF